MMEIILNNCGPDVHIINHYAPHSGSKPEEKDTHWDILRQHTEKITRRHPLYILGDTNARLRGPTNDDERKIMGDFTFGKGGDYVDQMTEDMIENRQYLVDFRIQKR